MMSPILFNIALEKSVKEIYQGGIRIGEANIGLLA